jgi:hypothetical protein
MRVVKSIFTVALIAAVFEATQAAKAHIPRNFRASTLSSGSTSATGCSPSSGTCAQDGTDNYHSISLSYDNSTGKFSGTIKSNLCPNDEYGYVNGSDILSTSTSAAYPEATCISQTFPDPDYSSTPVAAALRDRVGLTIDGGVNIYGPMDDGFSTGQVCDAGSCDSGTDLNVCTEKLEYDCSYSLDWSLLPDDCGGHANYYHFHEKLACDYDTSSTSSHSELVGIALDGRGIYGMYEGDGATPTDLDACNGHYGTVPSYSSGDVSFDGADNVYHYHITSYAPFTVGCFGPVDSVDECKNLYSTCSTGYSCFTTTEGTINYDLDCPCFQQDGTTYNKDYSSNCNAAFNVSLSALIWAVVGVIFMFVKFF